MKMLVICAALATLVASPALAQSGVGPFVPDSPYPAYGAVNPYGSFARETGASTAARDAAINRCSTAAAKYPEYLWNNEEFQQYRACMAINGQPE
jgi:hypothetical protein